MIPEDCMHIINPVKYNVDIVYFCDIAHVKQQQ